MNKEARERRWANGEGYNRYIRNELDSFRKDAWKRQILEHFPEDRMLNILDIGTGPGFFACILAEEGHNVCAVDASESMLFYARENARELGVSPQFMRMDLNDLSFEGESFDVVVARNVTWTLERPDHVYAQLKHVLKPQGTLLVYDANWHMHFFDEELMTRVREREERFLRTYGRREVVSGGDTEYFATAPLTRIQRPAWDERALERLGFDVTVRENVGERVYEDWEKDLYAESPLFEICAIKREEHPDERIMRDYWQTRSHTFGFTDDRAKLREIGTRAARYLPAKPLKVLDVGTGPGTIACAMALMGHEVHGIDLAPRMIERARANAEKLGLDIRFTCATAGSLPFEDDSFDVVVSRNLTWALPEPEKTFEQWRRVLKPGGILMYRDGNHYLYHHDEQARRDRELVTEKLGSPHGPKRGLDIDYSPCDRAAYDLPLSRCDRPGGWDDEALPRMGFDIIAEELHMPQRLLRHGVYDQGHYTNFLIVARNGKRED